jgi:hypothetical protein
MGYVGSRSDASSMSLEVLDSNLGQDDWLRIFIVFLSPSIQTSRASTLNENIIVSFDIPSNLLFSSHLKTV